MRKTSTLLVLGILAVILTASYTGYVFWQKSSSEVENEKISNSLTEYKNQILKYENDRVLQAVAAKQTLDSLKSDSVQWSTIIKDIRNTLPKTDKGTDLVDVLSYSGTGSDEVSLSLKTLAESENPFIDVAKVIAAFDKSANFSNTFVPSISIGANKDGSKTLGFALSTKYLKANISENLSKTSR